MGYQNPAILKLFAAASDIGPCRTMEKTPCGTCSWCHLYDATMDVAQTVRDLEEKLNEAILTYSPYVKALKEAVAKVEAERDKLKIEVESWRRIAAI